MGCQRTKSRTFSKLAILFVVVVVVGLLSFFLFLSFFFSFLFLLFYLVFLTLLLLFSYLYSYLLHFLSFPCATLHCSPSQLFFLSLFIYSLPWLNSPLLAFPNLLPHYPSLLYIYHPLISLLYQPHTPPAFCKLWHKHPPLQQQNYTQTHTRAPKPWSPHTSSHTHPNSPLLGPPFQITQISISIQTTITLPNSSCL
jgi:hypothetical protein